MGKSRHTKSSWRGVNINDVENFLDDQRLQERLGTNFSTKPDEELFVIDTVPEDEHAEPDVTKPLTRIQKRRLLLTKKPNCFQGLENQSKVPEPSGIRNNVKPKTLSKKTEDKKFKKGIYKKKYEASKTDRNKALADKIKLKKSYSEFKTDLWADEDKKELSEWFTTDTKLCNSTINKRKPLSKKSKFLPVDTPHPGISYNPTYTAHKELLDKVVDEEMKIIKEEKHLNRVTSKMFRKVTQKEFEEERMAELLTKPEEDTVEDNSEYISINPPVVNKKKDRQKRRHMKEENLLKANIRMAAIEKKKAADIYKLRFIGKSIAEKEDKDGAKRTRRDVRKATEMKAPKLSAKTFVELPVAFSAVEDLSGNLRNVKPQGGGLLEHFTSLQRRGITSVSTPRVYKTKAKKRYKLSTHRMPWEQTEIPAKTKKK